MPPWPSTCRSARSRPSSAASTCAAAASAPVLGTALAALATIFAVVALYQAATEDIWRNPKVIVANAYAPFFRANSLFWDPSLFGRFEVVAILAATCVLVLAPTRERLLWGVPAIGLWFAGLYVSTRSRASSRSASAWWCGRLRLAPPGRRRAPWASSWWPCSGASALPQTRHLLSATRTS